jgi:hypothetical protein
MAAAATTRVLVYEGPFGPQLARLKKVSVFSMGCTLVGVPLLAVFGNEGMQPVQRGESDHIGWSWAGACWDAAR